LHFARRYHLSHRQLRALNNLGARTGLRAGQRLRVYPPAAQRAKQASRSVASAKRNTHVTRLAGKAGGISHPATARRHVVRRGETLTGLARRYGVSVQALMSANGLSARSQLKAGTAIRIPA
jgi:LysM repeat protein